jgi:hypothetical protein
MIGERSLKKTIAGIKTVTDHVDQIGTILKDLTDPKPSQDNVIHIALLYS